MFCRFLHNVMCSTCLNGMEWNAFEEHSFSLFFICIIYKYENCRVDLPAVNDQGQVPEAA